MGLTYDLYVDDSGTRTLNASHSQPGDGAADVFALGGIFVASEAAKALADEVRALKERCQISSYLRSYEIRKKKGNFTWLAKEPERAQALYDGIEALIDTMPCWATAVVIDRPGYNARYADKYAENRWELCRSAYDILVERTAKVADADGRRLKIFVEGTGKREDRLIRHYHANLRQSGLEFQAPTSSKYNPLSPADFARITMKNPEFTKKGNPLSDLADLVLFPLTIAKHNPAYSPYMRLQEAGKIIDCKLSKGPPDCGVKYYCFDDPKFWPSSDSEKAGAHF